MQSGDKKEKYLHIFSELQETEQNYLKALTLMRDVYRNPLVKEVSLGNIKGVRVEDLAIIFSNLEDLIALHEQVASSLRTPSLFWLVGRPV